MKLSSQSLICAVSLYTSISAAPLEPTSSDVSTLHARAGPTNSIQALYSKDGDIFYYQLYYGPYGQSVDPCNPGAFEQIGDRQEVKPDKKFWKDRPVIQHSVKYIPEKNSWEINPKKMLFPMDDVVKCFIHGDQEDQWGNQMSLGMVSCGDNLTQDFEMDPRQPEDPFFCNKVYWKRMLVMEF